MKTADDLTLNDKRRTGGKVCPWTFDTQSTIDLNIFYFSIIWFYGYSANSSIFCCMNADFFATIIVSEIEIQFQPFLSPTAVIKIEEAVSSPWLKNVKSGCSKKAGFNLHWKWLIKNESFEMTQSNEVLGVPVSGSSLFIGIFEFMWEISWHIILMSLNGFEILKCHVSVTDGPWVMAVAVTVKFWNAERSLPSIFHQLLHLGKWYPVLQL